MPGHPLLVGCETAGSNGAQERVIAQTTGDRSMTVSRKYIREGSLLSVT